MSEITQLSPLLLLQAGEPLARSRGQVQGVLLVGVGGTDSDSSARDGGGPTAGTVRGARPSDRSHMLPE